MKQKILKTCTVFVLVILPLLLGGIIGKHSPYIETNSFKTYVLIWTAFSIVFASVALLLVRKFQLASIGFIPFLLLCPIVGIVGLAAPPDLSIKMLDHPEREHLRYTFLFLAALLFGVFAVSLLRGNHLKIKGSSKWLIALLFTLAFAEFIWEFTHHYLYPEGLKDWVTAGNNADEFGKHYDNINVITVGVIGRYIQFTSIIWLSISFYKARQTKLWSPVLVCILGTLGIISATVTFITQMNYPKGLEFLFLFFIPGMPFLALYWLGAALLTNLNKDAIKG